MLNSLNEPLVALPGGNQVTRKDSVADGSAFGTSIVALMVMMQWGIPFVMIGIPAWLTTQIMTLLVFSAVLFRFFFKKRYGVLDKWEVRMVAFLSYCYLVTVISNIFILNQSISEWGTSLTYLFPLMFVLAARPLGIKTGDILHGIVIACLVGGSLATADHFSPIAALNELTSKSAVSAAGRRLVLMHNESAFAIPILVALILDSKRFSHTLFLIAALSIISFSLLIISESRLAVGGAAIGSVIYLLFMYKGKWKFHIILTSICLFILIMPYIYDRYIQSLLYVLDGGLDKLTSVEDSTNFRRIEIAHFGNYFDKTFGLGYGLMTISPLKSNFLSQSMFSLSALYNVDYQMSMIDIRIYSALFQFGYIGLAGVIWLTYVTIKANISIGLRALNPYRQEIAAVGCTMIGYILSPLPANLFTADNTILIGGLIYALAALGLNEEKTIQANTVNFVAA